MVAQIGDRIVVGSSVVPDVEIDPDRSAIALRHRLRELVGVRVLVRVDPRVVVDSHRNTVMSRPRSHPGDDVHVGRRGDGRHAQGLGHLEAPVDLLVREVVLEAQVVRVQCQAGARETLANGRKVIEADGRPPPSQLFAGITPPQFTWLDVTFPELAAGDPDVDHAVDEPLQVAVAETIALGPDQHPGNPRLGATRLRLSGPPRRPGQQARRHQLVPFPSRQLGHVVPLCAAHSIGRGPGPAGESGAIKRRSPVRPPYNRENPFRQP